MRRQSIDCYALDFEKTQDFSFPKKELFVHKTTGNLTTAVLEETTQDSFIKSNQPIGHQLKRKVLYISMFKSIAVDTHPHKRILQEDVQASGAGSKPLITLSAMGFISSTYSENCSSEQPTTTRSPIRDKFVEGRKDLTNPKA